ncbi:MAG TPA: TlpA disulfide reductase family protein [Ktedonobacteraceae bacterium]
MLLTQLLTPASQAHTDPLIDHAAPDFALALLSPQKGTRILSLADFRGKPLVINFWASWCEPCKEEAPLLQNAWRQAHEQGKDVVFLGIDFQEAQGEALRFLQDYHITYPLVLDTSGAVAGKYSIASLPDTIFINRSGTVVSKVAQQITVQALARNLQFIES